LLQEV